MKHTTILSALALSCSLCAASAAFAKLPVPAPTPEAKAKAAETAAKAAWSDKVATYQLCQSQDRAAAAYRLWKCDREVPSCLWLDCSTGFPDAAPFRSECRRGRRPVRKRRCGYRHRSCVRPPVLEP